MSGLDSVPTNAAIIIIIKGCHCVSALSAATCTTQLTKNRKLAEQDAAVSSLPENITKYVLFVASLLLLNPH